MTEEFSKKQATKFGARGAETYGEEEKTIDTDGLSETVERIDYPFCRYGHPILTAPGDVYTCVNCDCRCCENCYVEISRHVLCVTCGQLIYGLDKTAYLTLIFLDHDLMSPDDLIEVTTLAGEVIEIEIDTAAETLVEHGYLTEDGGLSPEGKEALAVGGQIFGDDGDVQRVREQIRIQEVVDRG